MTHLSDDDFWNSPFIDAHRRGICNMDWATQQPREQGYFVGDFVEFMVGGFGLITEVSHSGSWPPTYSAEKVLGYPFHAGSKCAWHHHGDIKELVSPSPTRSIKAIKVIAE